MSSKIMLFSLIMVFFYTTAAFGTTSITFTFANGQTTGTDLMYYEFDVMAAAGESGTRIGDSMAYINYNTAAFGSWVKNNGKITVGAGTLTQGILMVNDNTASRVAITAQTAHYIKNQPELANELPTTPTQWVHVKIEIADPSETAGLSFEQSLMSDNEYESDNSTKYSPVIAIDVDDSPVPVELSSFTAIDSAVGVELEWTTQTEVNKIGFYIYRSETEEGEFIRVNKKIVESAGDSATPHTYSYIDDSVFPDVNTYFYYLENADIAGIRTKSQIIKVTRRKVSKFTAEYQGNSVYLKWFVGPKIYVPAWNIYRSTDENGAYVKLDEPQIEFDDTTHIYSYADPFPYHQPSEALYYYVEEMDSEGRLFIKSRTIKVEIIPDSFALFQNYPNPNNPETWIPYQLPVDTTVTIKIYAVTGHVVRTLSLGEKRTGIYISRNRAAYWNGRNEAGERVSSGLYFYAIEAGNFSDRSGEAKRFFRAIKRMLLVK